MKKKTVTITINGEAYPCRPTMGALLRFKRETGKEVTEINNDNISDLCTLLWCCVASASSADGKAFDLSLLDFADNVMKEDVLAWASSLEPEADKGGGDEKKSR